MCVSVSRPWRTFEIASTHFESRQPESRTRVTFRNDSAPKFTHRISTLTGTSDRRARLFRSVSVVNASFAGRDERFYSVTTSVTTRLSFSLSFSSRLPPPLLSLSALSLSLSLYLSRWFSRFVKNDRDTRQIRARALDENFSRHPPDLGLVFSPLCQLFRSKCR